MTPAGWLALSFAGVAVLCIVGLVVLTASESVTIGRLVSWWHLRKAAKERARARRLPVARLIERTDVVSLADCVNVRRVK